MSVRLRNKPADRIYCQCYVVEVIVVLSKTPLEINLLVVYPYDSFLLSFCRI